MFSGSTSSSTICWGTYGSNSADKFRHIRSVAYSAELVLNKQQGGRAYLDCYPNDRQPLSTVALSGVLESYDVSALGMHCIRYNLEENLTILMKKTLRRVTELFKMTFIYLSSY